MSVVPLCRSFTAALLLLCAVPAFADYVVTTDVDEDNPADGHCSLREALQAVNGQANYHECTSATPGESVVSFAIAPNVGETHVIALTAVLPAITRSITLDGTKQSGTTCAPMPNLRVQIANPSQLAIDGLTFAASGDLVQPTSLVEGVGFAGFAATQKAGLVIERNDVEVGCTIVGADLSGTVAQPNFYGIYVNAPAATIGVVSSTQHLPNLISGNSMVNVYVDASGSDATISGNYIGVDTSGQKPLPSAFGVYSLQVAGLRIGYAGGDGPAEQQRNVIGVASAPGTTSVNVEFDTAANDDALSGNFVGVGADGVTALSAGTQLAVSIFKGKHVLVGCDGSVAMDLCRNVIANPSGVAIVNYEGALNSAIVGNYIGVGADGTSVLAASNVAVAIQLQGADALVARNILSTDGVGTAIVLSPSSENQTPVFMNQVPASSTSYIMLDSSDNCVQGNGAGISIADATNPTELSTDFTNNWWGAANGPSPGGSGNSVAANVVYSPFLTAPSAYCGGSGGPNSPSADTIFDNSFN